VRDAATGGASFAKKIGYEGACKKLKSIHPCVARGRLFLRAAAVATPLGRLRLFVAGGSVRSQR